MQTVASASATKSSTPTSSLRGFAETQECHAASAHGLYKHASQQAAGGPRVWIMFNDILFYSDNASILKILSFCNNCTKAWLKKKIKLLR